MTQLTREQVYKAIDTERAYQEMRIVRDGSTAVGEHHHSPEEFLLFIEHYLHEARVTASTTWGPSAKPAIMDKLRKVAALCVAAGELNGMPSREGF